MNPENLTLGLAFIAGLVSFISPCVLPLVPAYIGYMGGRVTNTVAAQVAGGGMTVARPSLSLRFTTVLHGLAFVAGFTFVFVTFGIISNVFVRQLGGLSSVNLVSGMIGRLGGLIIIFFGLHFMGILPPLFARLKTNPQRLNHPLVTPLLTLAGAALILWGFSGALLPSLVTIIPTTAGNVSQIYWPAILAYIVLAIFLLWLVLGGAFTAPSTFWLKVINTVQTILYTDTRRQMTASGKQGLGGSALMGIVFSAGWTPCIGPVYGAVIGLAATTGDVGQAGLMFAAYSLGLGIPFLLTALLLDGAQGILRRLQRHMRKIELVSGGLLIFIGVLVASGNLQSLSQYLNVQFGDLAYQMEQNVVDSIIGKGSPPTPEATPEGEAARPLALTSITGAAANIASVGLEIGDTAPTFQTLSDSGENINLAQLRGQVVLVNFWATWCVPCRREMPEFQSAYQARAGQGFTVLAINNQEALDQIKNFRSEMSLDFPLLLDNTGIIQELYGVRGYPSTFLINREGVIVARFFGPMAAAQIQQAVDDALAA